MNFRLLLFVHFTDHSANRAMKCTVGYKWKKIAKWCFQKKFIRIAYYSSTTYFFCENPDNSEIVPRIIEQKLSFISRNQWLAVVVVCCSCWEQTFDVSFTSVKKVDKNCPYPPFTWKPLKKWHWAIFLSIIIIATKTKEKKGAYYTITFFGY